MYIRCFMRLYFAANIRKFFCSYADYILGKTQFKLSRVLNPNAGVRSSLTPQLPPCYCTIIFLLSLCAHTT
jgi:hypothetical protein